MSFWDDDFYLNRENITFKDTIAIREKDNKGWLDYLAFSKEQLKRGSNFAEVNKKKENFSFHIFWFLLKILYSLIFSFFFFFYKFLVQNFATRNHCREN